MCSMSWFWTKVLPWLGPPEPEEMISYGLLLRYEGCSSSRRDWPRLSTSRILRYSSKGMFLSLIGLCVGRILSE